MFQSTFLSKYFFTSSVDQDTSRGSSDEVTASEARSSSAPDTRNAFASKAMPSELDKTRIGLPSGVSHLDAG